VRHPADLFKVGDSIMVKVMSFDLEKERISLGLKQLTPDPWTVVDEKYPLGSRVTGTVVSLTDYGAFVELEPGVEGLIHISEMSWTRKVRHPSQVLSVGDVVEATVLEVEPQRKRISLSLKQVEPNPWEVIGEKYPVGSVIEGKIKNITDFGVFIGIDEGIDGLVHISDISWTKRFKHPSELFKKGQVIQAKVLYIDKDNERFSLSIKDLADNPWQTIDQRFPMGSIVSGPITNITDFGLFVEVEEGIEGLIHISDVSWTRKLNHPSEMLKRGEIVEAKVLSVDQENKKISLGIKQLKGNPWDEIDRRFSVGDSVTGTISNITGFGLFVELGDGIEGLVHISQVEKRQDEDIKATYKVGDQVTARILRIDPVERKIGLSIKDYLDVPDRGRGGAKESAPRPEPALHNPVLSEDISFTALGGEEPGEGTS